MSKQQKLLARLKSQPKDFSWAELTALLGGLGYSEVKPGKTGGSRRRFVHATAPRITLHKPHPNPVIKPYAVKEVLSALSDGGLLE